MTAPGAGDTAPNRVERLRRLNPAAVTLAVLAATAVRVEPALLRRLRLLVPEADVGAESDLWSSGLLASASPLAVSFEPDCAELLRRELGSPAYDDLRGQANAVIEAAHTGLHWSLRLEETINRLMLGSSPDLDQAEKLLYAAVGALRSVEAGDGTDPVRVARWLLGALGRLPARLRSTRAGVVAAVGAGIRLDGRFAGAPGDGAGVDAWMPWLLELAGIRDRHVTIRFAPDALVLNGTGPDCAEIRVPGTAPMVLNLTWHDGQVQHRRVEFHAGQTRQIPVSADQVELRDLTGAGYTVARPNRGRQGLRPPDGLDFKGHRAALRPCLGRSAELDRIVRAVRHDDAAVVTVAGPPGAGKTVLLGAALDELEAQGYAVADHFYGVEPRWDAPPTVATSLMAQIRGAVTAPPATPAWEGRRRALIITNGAYRDRHLAGLRPVDGDAALMREALVDPETCGFDVEVLADADRRETSRRLSAFFGEADPADLLLVYVATHAITEGSGLTFATQDTDLDFADVTGISSRTFAGLLAGTPARSIAILDCCQIDRGVSRRASVAPLREHVSTVRTGTVLSAPLHFEYRIGQDHAVRALAPPERRSFTRAVAEALRSGLADLDGDGAVTADELGRFVSDRATTGSGVVAAGPASDRTPVLARRPVVPRPLPLRLDPDGRIPVSFLEQAVANARGRLGGSLRGVVIALDGVPEPVVEFVRATTPLPGSLPDNVHVIATVRSDDGGRFGRSLASAAYPVTLDRRSGKVCRSLVDYHRGDLARAFGRPDAGAELIGLADEVPGRLAALISWAADQPTGAARADDLPPLAAMATDGFWSPVAAKLLDVLVLIVAARPGLTVRALIAAAGTRPAGVRSQLTQLATRRLIRLSGEPDDEDTTVTVSAREVVAEVTRRYPDRIAQAHRRHAAAFPFGNPRAALPYQVESVARHAAAGGDAALVDRVVHCGSFLNLRRRQHGVDAVLDDLAVLAAAAPESRAASTIHSALSGLAAVLREAPEFFVDLLRGRLTAGGAGSTAADLFAGWPEPVLSVRALSPVGGPGFRTVFPRPVRAATERDGRMIFVSGAAVHWDVSGAVAGHGLLFDAPVLGVAEVDGRMAIATSSNLTLVAAGGEPRTIDAGPATVTALLGGDSVHLGLADGRILQFAPTAHGATPLRRLVGHLGPVTALATSSDAIVSAGIDGTVRVWTRGSEGVPRQVYRGHRAAVTALTEVRPGWMLSGDADGELRLWATASGTERTVPSGHTAPITRLLALPGHGVASADQDGVVQLWEWDGGLTVRPVRRYRAPGGEAVTRLAHGGGLLALSTTAGTIHWLDAGTGAALLTVEAGDEVHEMTFARDGSLLVAHGGGVRSYAPVPHRTGPVGVRYRQALAVDRAGKAVLAGLPGGVATLSGSTMTAVDDHGDPAVSAAWTADGVALTVRGSGRAHLGNAADPGEGYVLVAAGSRSSWLLRGDGEIRQVTRSGSRIRWRAGYGAEATALAVDDDGIGLLAVGHANGQVRVSRLDGRSVAEILTSGGRMLSLAAAAGLLVGLSADGTLWRLPTDGSAPPVRLGRHDGAVEIAMSGPGLVSCSADGTLRLWNTGTGALLGIVAGRLPFHAVAASPDGRIVARDATDRIWFLQATPEQTAFAQATPEQPAEDLPPAGRIPTSRRIKRTAR